MISSHTAGRAAELYDLEAYELWRHPSPWAQHAGDDLHAAAVHLDALAAELADQEAARTSASAPERLW